MLAPDNANTSPQDLALSPLFGHFRPAPHRLCQPWHGLYFMHQFLARKKWAEQTLSLPGLTVVIPHEECDLVWRRRPCWVGCCVLKPALVALYTFIQAQMYRLRLLNEYIQTHISSLVNCILPCLYSLKLRSMCMQNFISPH